MLFVNKIPYKLRLISFYIITTLIGISLTLVAIYNASEEQLALDQIDNLHEIYSDHIKQLEQPSTQKSAIKTLEQLSRKLHSPVYPVIPYSQTNNIEHQDTICPFSLSPKSLNANRLNPRGGIIGLNDCRSTWVLLDSSFGEDSVLVLHRFESDSSNAIVSAYTQRLLVPMVFFIWITVWSSLILGNLVNRLQKQKDEVEHLALHDSLTGLPNRKYFLDAVAELINYSQRQHSPFILAMIDLNKFKAVNDNLGHQYGDMLLEQVAQRLKSGIRDYDTIARLGGDEFVLLLPGTDLEASMTMLTRIYETITAPYQLDNKTAGIGASIGVSLYPKHDTTYAELVHKADIAMYQAKQAGGGITTYDPSSAPNHPTLMED